MVIYDIGCNVGNWLDANYNKKDTFIAVEANPEAWTQSWEKFKLRPNVEILNWLVADEDGHKRPFYVSHHSTGEVSSASMDWVKKSRHSFVETWSDPILVETKTLDSLIKEYGDADFIKIDVEGYEFEVLKGLTKPVPLLCLEWAEEFKGKLLECLDYLWNIGYREFYIQYGDDYKFRPTDFVDYERTFKAISNMDANRMQQWGMLFARYKR